ncbi:hypothetical protein M0804_008891 [Polistes exclamans]|nr:hypothetical protein M0804_008891 [Polistes exclamans]
MTPLTWWVLLGTLFVHARIVPARIYEIENACAILCQAEKLLLLESNEEGNLVGKVGEKEGNDDDEEDVKEGKVMVLVEEDDEVEGGVKGIVVGEENYEVFHVTSQFVEGRRGGLQHRRRRRRRRRDGVVNDHNHNHHDYHDHHHHLSLNDYCLISNQIRLHCREFFINLRNRQGCNCRLISSSIRTKLIKDGTNINPKDSNKLSDLSLKREQQLQQQQEKQEQFRRVLVKEEEEEEEIREENKRFLLATMKTMMRNPKELSTIKDYHYYLPIKMETNNQDLVSSAPDNPSNSDEIDWDLWCMAQCDIGHGGSACECDIIP